MRINSLTLIMISSMIHVAKVKEVIIVLKLHTIMNMEMKQRNMNLVIVS